MAEKRDRPSAADPVLRKIGRIRRHIALWAVGRGYLWAALLAVGLLFIAVLADHLFILQQGGRVAFFYLLMLAGAGTLVVSSLWPLLRRMSPLYIARRIEQHEPGVRNSLISYLECREDPRTPNDLKRLMGMRAALAVRDAGPNVAVDYRHHARLALAALAVLFVFFFYGLFSPKSALVSMRRVLRPDADIRPPTATQIQAVEPGDVYAVRGQAPEITVRLGGLLPQAVHAVWESAEGEPRRLLLSQDEGRGWRGRFPPLLEDGSYYLVAGDTRSRRFTVEVLPKPAVEEVRLHLLPPAYTAQEPRTAVNADVEVPAGTRVRVTARTSLPPGRGRLQFRSGRRFWLDARPDLEVLQGEFVALESDGYTVRFESRPYPDGSVFSNESPVSYDIHVLADEAPEVELHDPPDRAEFSRAETAHIVYSAEDDYGVSAVRLRYTIDGRFGDEVEVAAPDVRQLKRASHAWELAATGVLPGQTISYFLEAEDNQTDTPNVGRSEVRRILVGERRPPAEEGGAPPPGEQASEPGSGSEAAEPPEPAEDPRTADGEAEETPEGTTAETEQPTQQESPKRPGTEKTPRDVTELGEYLESVLEDLDNRGESEPGSGESATPEAPGQEAASGDAGEPDGAGSGESAQGLATEAVPQEGGTRQTGPGGEAASSAEGEAYGADSSGAGEGQPGEGASSDADQQEGSSGPAGPSSGSPEGEGAASGSEGTSGAGSGQAGPLGGQDGAGEAPGGVGTRPPGSDGDAQSGPGGGEDASPGEGSAAGSREQAGTEGHGAGQGEGASGTGQSASAGSGTSASDAAGQAQGEAAVSAAGGGPGGSGVNSLPGRGGEQNPRIPDWEELDRRVRELEVRLDGGEISDKMLDDLGTNRQDLLQAIEEYKRRRERASSEESIRPPRVPLERRPGALLSSGEAGQEVSVQDVRPNEVERDDLRARMDSLDRLAPRYRDLVDQYYKALSEEE